MRIILILISICLIQCKSEKENSEVQKLYDQVMLVHDEVMPEMGTMQRLRKQIRELENVDSLGMSIVTDLEQADEHMMQWMSDFSAYRQLKNAKADEKLQYLHNELNNISEVSMKMKGAIKNAKEYIEDKNDSK